MGIISFRHSKPAGDLVGSLAGIKQVCSDTNSKAIIYQRLNFRGIGYVNAKHPFEDEEGYAITMNKYMFDMLRPLIIAQEYIEDFIVYEGQEIDYDLDRAIQETFTNQPHGSLNRWLFYVYPQMSCDLSKEWLTSNQAECITGIKNEKPMWYQGKRDGNHDAIIINFTDRYRNYVINYFFLKKYQDKTWFAGLPSEHENFCKQWGLDLVRLNVNDFNELGMAIKSCKFFMGNASVCFQLAEAMKVPRLLEIYPQMPNVIPCGENAFDAYHQKDIEFLFEKLFNLDK